MFQSRNLLRQLAETDDETGRKVKQCLHNGELVPTDQFYPLLKSTMQGKMIQCRGLLIDGFPRTLAQARQLKEEVR